MGTIKNIFVLLLLSLFQFFSISNDEINSNVYNKTHNIIIPPDINPTSQLIYLNEYNSVQIGNGAIKKFYFTPTDSEFYVVETFGSCDTLLRVENTYSGSINDDDSGEGFNSRILFKASANQTIYIYVKLLFNFSGTFQLQLRRQYFSMFAYEDHDGNSTIPDLNEPENAFGNIFDCRRYENTSSSHALSNDDRGLSRLNSEVVFFTGHGYKNTEPTVEMGFGVAFAEGGITLDTQINMNETRFAMWSACYSSNSNNHWNKSFAEYSVECGAKSALGFEESIGFWSANFFSNELFDSLADGNSIEESALNASISFPFYWDNVLNHTIFGDENIVLTNSTISNGNFPPVLYKKGNTLSLDLPEDEYETHYLVHGITRLYQIVNEMISDSYVDLVFDNKGELLNAFDKRHSVDHVFPSLYDSANYFLEDTILIENDLFHLKKSFSNLAYCSIEGSMYPILFLNGIYENEFTVIEECKCYNLFSDEQLDYGEICEAIIKAQSV